MRIPGLSALTHGRFLGESTLDAVAKGERVLAPGDSGEAVRRIQTALRDSGYPVRGAESAGMFADDTTRALADLQADHRLPRRGVVDHQTLAVLDRVAPPPGQERLLFPDYGRLADDGVLEATVGVGFDESGAGHGQISAEVVRQLEARGLRKLEPGQPVPAALQGRLAPGATYYAGPWQVAGQDVTALVRLVTPSSEHPKRLFVEGFDRSGLTFYAGHARNGTGPDFGPLLGSEEHLVLRTDPTPALGAADGSAPRLAQGLAGRTPELASLSFAERYRLAIFQGCTTAEFLQPLRQHSAQTGRRDLDVLATDELLEANAEQMARGLGHALDAVRGGDSLNALRSRLSNETVTAYSGDGFTTNRWLPAELREQTTAAAPPPHYEPFQGTTAGGEAIKLQLREVPGGYHAQVKGTPMMLHAREDGRWVGSGPGPSGSERLLELWPGEDGLPARGRLGQSETARQGPIVLELGELVPTRPLAPLTEGRFELPRGRAYVRAFDARTGAETMLPLEASALAGPERLELELLAVGADRQPLVRVEGEVLPRKWSLRTPRAEPYWQVELRSRNGLARTLELQVDAEGKLTGALLRAVGTLRARTGEPVEVQSLSRYPLQSG